MAESDGRRENAGRGDGLTAALTAARDTAPDDLDDELQIASVAWAAWESGRDVTEIWREVLQDG